MSGRFRTTYFFCGFLAIFTFQATSALAKEAPVLVSVIKLLGTPDRYVDRSIVVKGYLSNRPGLSLYVTRDHALMNDIVSSIFVSQEPGISESSCANSYVEIEGRFLRVGKSSFGIGRIEKISDARSSVVCWSSAEE